LGAASVFLCLFPCFCTPTRRTADLTRQKKTVAALLRGARQGLMNEVFPFAARRRGKRQTHVLLRKPDFFSEPLGRCGIEPSWEPGKLPPPVPARSERVAGSAGIPHASDPPAGADQRTHAAISESDRRTRVQRACPPSPPSPFGRRQGSCSPRGICTDLVQNSIRDRRRHVAADPPDNAALRP